MLIMALCLDGCTYVDMFANAIRNADGAEEGAAVTQLVMKYEIGMSKRMGDAVFNISHEESGDSSSDSDDDDNDHRVESPQSDVHYKRRMEI